MSATTRIDIGRGVGQNDAGDDVALRMPPLDDADREPGVEYAEVVTPPGGIPASLIEVKRTETDAATDAVRIVRGVRARFADRVQVRAGDLVRDRTTGDVYPVESVVVARAIGGGRRVRCDLTGTLGE